MYSNLCIHNHKDHLPYCNDDISAQKEALPFFHKMNLRERRLWHIVDTLNLPYPAARLIVGYLDAPSINVNSPIWVYDHIPEDADYVDDFEAELRGYSESQRAEWAEESWKFAFVDSIEEALDVDPFAFVMSFRGFCVPSSVYCGPEFYGYQQDWLDCTLKSIKKDNSNPWYELKLVNADMPAHVTRTEGYFKESDPVGHVLDEDWF